MRKRQHEILDCNGQFVRQRQGRSEEQPTSCKEQVRTGERSILRCGNELTAQQDVPAKGVAAKAAQVV